MNKLTLCLALSVFATGAALADERLPKTGDETDTVVVSTAEQQAPPPAQQTAQPASANDRSSSGNTTTGSGGDSDKNKPEKPSDKKPESDIPSKLNGFGVGISGGYTFQDEVKNAFLDTQGNVKIDKKSRGDASFIFEAHWLGETDYFLPKFMTDLGLNFVDCKKNVCGSGPFIAVKTGGSTELVESLGTGWMWSMRHRGDSALGGLKQWNFGIGLTADPSVHQLADGFRANEPLPAGEKEIRYKDDVMFGVMVLFSVGVG